jgi:hypothetical protein
MPSLKNIIRDYNAVPVATKSLGAAPAKVTKVTTRDEVRKLLADGQRKRAASAG